MCKYWGIWRVNYDGFKKENRKNKNKKEINKITMGNKIKWMNIKKVIKLKVNM